jgi:hypothetical protein
MNKLIRTSLGLAACGAATLIAYAAVTIDLDTGMGWIGKGDVQVACQYNNRAMQGAADKVSFFYQEQEAVEQDCYDNERGVKTYAGTRTKTTSLIDVYVDDPRKNSSGKDGPTTGFRLVGIDPEGSVDEKTNWNDGGTGNGCPEGSSPQGQPRFGASVIGLFTDCGDGRSVEIVY